MSKITGFTVPGLLALATVGIAVSQETRTEISCNDNRFGGDRRSAHICESRELTLAPEETLEIDGSPNGSVTVTGWDRNEIQVVATIHSWSRDEDAARDRLDSIEIDTDGTIRAFGPAVRNSWWPFGRRNGGWNVNFEIMAPRETDLWVESVNGRLSVTDIHGHLDADTINGAISLTNVSADVRGHSVNGSITAALAGETFDGDVFDVRTVNGRIVIEIPEDLSARLDVETVNGGIRSDFPVNREGRRNREASATLGDGGPLIRASTTNGGVRINRL